MANEKPDRVDMRLYNTIVIFDVYTVARSPEAAREAILAAIRDTLPPSESVAKEVTMANSIRSSWLEQAPWMGSDITDEEFEKLKGMTTKDAYDRFYTKTKK